jgi:hypothetical protein
MKTTKLFSFHTENMRGDVPIVYGIEIIKISFTITLKYLQNTNKK